MSTTLLWLEETFINPYQNALAAVGIDTAFKAGLVTAALTGLALWTIKPASVFDEKTGQPRPWVFFHENQSVGPEPVILPWYARAALVGYAVNLII